jgi:hypothetical protein
MIISLQGVAFCVSLAYVAVKHALERDGLLAETEGGGPMRWLLGVLLDSEEE